MNTEFYLHESERNRICLDLDRSLKGLFKNIKNHIAAVEEEIKQLERLDLGTEFNKLVDRAVTEATRLGFEPLPAILKKEGLIAATKTFAREHFENYQLNFEDEIEKFEVTKEHEYTYYRIIVDSLHILLEAGKATTLNIDFSEIDGSKRIVIRVLGNRFDEKALTFKEKERLNTIRSRAKFLRARLEIEQREETVFFIIT